MNCQNPFFECDSKGSHIAVIIRLNNKNYEVCDSCWEKIAESDIEWENSEVKVAPEKEERAIQLKGVEVPLKKLRVY
jgi:hypothetical protein